MALMQIARDNRNLPAIQATSAVATRRDAIAALVKAENPPKDVRVGVAKLMVSFPMPGMSPESGQLLGGVYYEAVQGFPLDVVLWTLSWLLFHNPRNTTGYTCPPTPQDVRAACQLTHRCWQSWVVDYYFEGKWAKPSTNIMLTKDNDDLMNRHYAAQRGGKPGDPHCIVPLDLQIHYLRQDIERQLPDIENEEKRKAQQYADPVLLLIKDDVLDRMPEAAFPDGALEMIRGKRAARIEAARKAEEREAYINGLPDEVRAVRWTVVASDQWKDKDEPEIMAETNRRLEIIRAARAETEADGGVFLGSTFDDGSEWRELDFKAIYRRSPRRTNR
jgi:hypothetical protein